MLVSKVAGITLGPKGRLVAIQTDHEEPRITKDGITVVKHIEFVLIVNDISWIDFPTLFPP
jgi:chaperonin GroEL (HSP60 family)